MIPIAEPVMGDEEKKHVQKVMESGMLSGGEEVNAFESEFATFCDSKEAVATSNGTTALHAAFEALELSDDARVVTTPFSFIASANAIRFAGAKPIFADIDPQTFNLDPDIVEQRIKQADGSVEAILAVHLYGNPAPMTELREIADQYDIHLVEDAAQAHGAQHRGKMVGSLGDIACFSFYPTKNMTTGEGGMVTTDDSELADRVAQFVNHGRDNKYEHATVGHNFRMTDIAAAIGREQLKKLPDQTEIRRRNASILNETLSTTLVETPPEQKKDKHVYHQYTIRFEQRDELKSYLNNYEIGTGIYYPKGIHQQPVYERWDTKAPKTERVVSEVLSLPVHPQVSVEQAEAIGDHIQEFCEEHR